MAAAFVEQTIQIWDLRSAERLSEFDSVYRFGGHRITMSPTGKTCVAAAWGTGSHGGVACYDAISGWTIWHRNDIRHTQNVRFSSKGDTVWCGVEEGKLQQLDAQTGETIDKLTGIKRLFDSEDSQVLLLDTRNRDLIIQGRSKVRIPKLSFGLLDGAFGPDSLCLSEAGGPVRCLDTESGVERWRYEPPSSSHVLRLGYRWEDQCFYGVQWEYKRGTSKELIRFSAEGGRAQEVRQLRSRSSDEEFCMHGDMLVTSSGEVISVGDGNLISQLAFPQKDYPDDPSAV